LYIADKELRNDFELSMDVHATTMVLTALIKLVEDEFAAFPLGDMLKQDCWLAKIPAPPLDEYGFRKEGVEPSAALSDLAASVAKMNVNVRCFDCTSPGLEEFSTDGSEDLAEVTDIVVNYVTDLLEGRFLQVQIDRALNNAAKRCPHSPEYDPEFEMLIYKKFTSSPESSMTFLAMIFIVTGVFFAILAAITLSVKCFVRTRHRRLLRQLPDRELYLLQKEQEQEDKLCAEHNAVTRSLFSSTSTVPAYARYLIPLVLLANIAFFLSGHLSLGATVNVQAQLAGQTVQMDGLFSFSMARSTIDIWNAGGKPLAALIFLFSGLWPYTKIVMTLVLWFAPPSRVSMETRGKVLAWIDEFTKVSLENVKLRLCLDHYSTSRLNTFTFYFQWSMIDIFVLFVSVAGFR